MIVKNRATKYGGLMPKVLQTPSLLTNEDIYLFAEGSHFRLYEKLGAHRLVQDRQEGTYFAV